MCGSSSAGQRRIRWSKKKRPQSCSSRTCSEKGPPPGAQLGDQPSPDRAKHASAVPTGVGLGILGASAGTMRPPTALRLAPGSAPGSALAPSLQLLSAVPSSGGKKRLSSGEGREGGGAGSVRHSATSSGDTPSMLIAAEVAAALPARRSARRSVG